MRAQSSRPAYPLAPRTPTGILCTQNAYYCMTALSTSPCRTAAFAPIHTSLLPLGLARCYRLATRPRMNGVDKRKRQAAILELVEERPVGSQEELRGFLRERGWDVTQSTLSRDLRELRLARVPTSVGVRYAVADGALSSAARPALDALLPQLLTRVDGVGELIVLRTVPGGAQPVASALDGESWPDVLGTVGGDDTILVVCRSAAARERIERRLRKLAEI
jgi:transcriptional regulator of arginine metabolism